MTRSIVEPKEIEFKYDAKDISLFTFLKFCKNATKSNYILAQGRDDFYGNPKRKSEFYRHRYGSDMNQLTFKKKLYKNNNYVRVERNTDLLLVV